jgi:hypothetical protein
MSVTRTPEWWPANPTDADRKALSDMVNEMAAIMRRSWDDEVGAWVTTCKNCGEGTYDEDGYCDKGRCTRAWKKAQR